MPRWYWFLSTIVLPAVVFACNDDTVQDVEQTVCFSRHQWIGGKRGDPRMYPGRDCVGCHLDNDGPELMFGGTVYAYQQAIYTDEQAATFKRQQTGEDCFGLEGVRLTITGADGQEFKVTSNEAGNFFVEGKATDLVKPFSVKGAYDNPVTGKVDQPEMGTHPHYGGCARCHTPGVKPRDADLELGESQDLDVKTAGGYVGIVGFNKEFFANPPAQQ